MRIYYATHNYEIIPCHLIARKDRDARGKYAANSKRDNRRFHTAFTNRKEAQKQVIEYELKKQAE